ncbi:MAG: LPXTG cell wall anchor domain-containing protein, partial [Pedobacter sp.]
GCKVLAYDVKTDASKLEAIEGKLFKGTDFYYMEADNDYKIVSTKISADAKFFPGVYSYRAYLSKALVDDDYIHFIGDRFNIHMDNKKKLTSKIVKQLGSFYLFNNALFDGDKSYPITADYESLNYLGSFVEVINGCAGEMPNTPQVDVKYHHFFRDKNSVYYFDEAGKKLQIIQTANVDDFTPDNYEHLQELYKIKDVKGSVKKKSTETGVNYYAIVGGVVAVLGLGVLYFKRRKA